jgi:hypothetical protein
LNKNFKRSSSPRSTLRSYDVLVVILQEEQEESYLLHLMKLATRREPLLREKLGRNPILPIFEVAKKVGNDRK